MAEEDKLDEGEFVKSLTAKEIKKLARPEFAANPDKFYPTETLRRLGFSRHNCPKCKNNYWRYSDKADTCGDSQCVGKYAFIGTPRGVGKEKKMTYKEAWESFARSTGKEKVPCTPIARYPVVARWRADVDFTAAGIFCFQPYCVTGELEPPANPLVCPQFCLRFNDLDNIGLTGRHYSGFIMMGLQVFNSKDNYKMWHDECVEYNFKWLTEELKLDPEEITFIEDVWAGGGNLGPSIEYFVGGLELGNMVFMQFKTFPDGSREPLDVQVIDVGIGLERVPWLVNGSPTSYCDVFPSALEFLLQKTGVNPGSEIWEKFGPQSCMLNVDEVDDIDAVWADIAGKIGKPVDEVRTAIQDVKELYVILDHTRSVMMAIEDGSLPSNVGGAANVRNILRRVFAILHQRGWWETIGDMEGFLKLFQCHKDDLGQLYGTFPEYKSFAPIIELEYERWKSTDEAASAKLQKMLKKKKELSLDDWILAITSWGIPVDVVARVTKTDPPGNLWYVIAERQEQMVRVQPAILYNTSSLTPTKMLLYDDHTCYSFTSTITAVFPNVTTKDQLWNIVVLDESHFYPTSGGQEHDTGGMTIDGKEYKVVDVMKVGPCVLHVLDQPLPQNQGDLDSFKGKSVTATIDEERRAQLRNNHTSTHIVYASCRKVLGPHVWQHGAKKTTKQAHLDITHYKSLSNEEVLSIENEANRIVRRCKQINKSFMAKDVAEKEYGFHLYQGGVVPGNELRVVSIDDTDTEACCGTHADNTAEVGYIKVLRTARISDGIVRLYFVAGENALLKQNVEKTIMNQLCTDWGVGLADIPMTADRFFTGYKTLSSQTQKQVQRIIELQCKCTLMDSEQSFSIFESSAESPTMCISNCPNFAKAMSEQSGKGVMYVGATWMYALMSDDHKVDTDALQAFLNELHDAAMKQEESKSEEKSTGDVKKIKPPQLRISKTVTVKPKSKKDKKQKIEKVCEITCFALPPNCQGKVIAKVCEEYGFILQE